MATLYTARHLDRLLAALTKHLHYVWTCVSPMHGGVGAHRRAVSRYPADWNMLAQEEDIRTALEPFVGERVFLVSWELESALQQASLAAKSYLFDVSPPKFEDVVKRWWNSITPSPSADEVSLVVRFSAWVLEKQSHRKGLIQKLLCLDKNGNLQLRPAPETLLTEPYAGDYRRVFFPNTPSGGCEVERYAHGENAITFAMFNYFNEKHLARMIINAKWTHSPEIKSSDIQSVHLFPSFGKRYG
jgi:hypothetical protein